MRKLSKSTQSLTADRHLEQNKMIAPPLFLSVTHFAESEQEFAEISSRPLEDGFYTRYGNPTTSRVAEVIAKLEGAETALMTASGMGAISSSILSFLKQGDHVVAQKSHYIGTTKLMKEFLPRFGVEATLVPQSSPAAFEQAIRPNTKLIMLETPVNPTMELTDLAAIAKIAKPKGILTLCDNTFATPIIQRPLEWGVDLVLHSVTKYMGGHHDLLAGCVAGSKAHIQQIWNNNLVLGAISAPMNSWLALRGIRTLDIRVKKQSQSASLIANFLEQHSEVSRVYYPGLASHPQQALIQKQMQGMGGGVMSFVLKKGYNAGVSFLKKLQIIQNAASLGGIDTLAIQPAVMWGGRLPEDVIKEQGIDPGMIRMAIGIEDPQDLIADLSNSLDKL